MDRASKLNQSLLSDGTTSFKLQINESAAAHGGLGLVTTKNILVAQDIICKKQMLVVADSNHLNSTCDNCFLWLGSEIGKNGCIRAAGDAEPSLDRCRGCKVVRYCSKVSFMRYYFLCYKLCNHGRFLSLDLIICLHSLWQSCQRGAWEHHHKAECKIFAQQEKSNEVIRATVRLLLNRKAGVIDDSEWSDFLNLQSHKEDYNEGGDMLKQAILETARWTGWDEADEAFKETYCRVRQILKKMILY